MITMNLLIIKSNYDCNYDYTLIETSDHDYDYDNRKICNQLQSITIVIVIGPNPDKGHKVLVVQYEMFRTLEAP